MVLAGMAVVAAVAYALCNSLFVTVVGDWTNHKILWPPLNDVLLGLWMIVSAVQRSHNMFLLQTKKVGFLRYMYFIEGVVFVSAALLIARRGQLPGIIVCSVICSTVFSASYGVRRISRYFEWPVREVGLRWLIPAGRLLLLFVPAALAIWWLFQHLRPPILRLAVHALLGGSIGFYLFLRFGLSHSFQRELLQRAPGRVNPLLRWVFVGAGQ